MRVLLNSLADPYLHLFLVGIFLVRLAMGLGGDAGADAVNLPASGPCTLCGDSHGPHELHRFGATLAADRR